MYTVKKLIEYRRERWYTMGEEDIIKAKEDDDMSAYVKPIQATPTLTGKDAINIVQQVLKAPTPESVNRNKKRLELRKSIEGNKTGE